MPWGAKDLLAEDSYRTTWGAKPFEDQRIDADATVVRITPEGGIVTRANTDLVISGINSGQNLAITGPAGSGKTWLACALGNQACRQGRQHEGRGRAQTDGAGEQIEVQREEGQAEVLAVGGH